MIILSAEMEKYVTKALTLAENHVKKRKIVEESNRLVTQL